MTVRFIVIPGFAAALTVSAVCSALAQSTETPPAAAPPLAVPTEEAAPAGDSFSDPFQSLNRATFNFNAALSTVITEPVAEAYRSVVPESVQTGIDNAFTNLREPLTALSSGLQGDLSNAGTSAGRFALNTTVGIVGLFDVATEMGWVSRPEDIGSTLCSYGIKSGPYIVLPFFGPSTAREAVGLAATYALTFNIAPDSAVNYIVADRAVSAASDPNAAPAAAAPDPYVAQRDAYLELRAEICSDALPRTEIKASPLGGIKRISG